MSGNVEVVKNAPRENKNGYDLRSSRFTAVDSATSLLVKQKIGRLGHSIYVDLLESAGSSFECTSATLAACCGHDKPTEARIKQVKRIVTKLSEMGLVDRVFEGYEHDREKGKTTRKYRYVVYEVPKETAVSVAPDKTVAAGVKATPIKQDLEENWWTTPIDKSDFDGAEIVRNVEEQERKAMHQQLEDDFNAEAEVQRILAIVPESQRKQKEHNVREIVDIGVRNGFSCSENFDMLLRALRLAMKAYGEPADKCDIAMFAVRIKQSILFNTEPEFNDIIQKKLNSRGG